jgi:long-chain acyl-CoA synthetase
VNRLAEMCLAALSGDPAQPVIEFRKRWVTRAQIRHVAGRVASLIEAGAPGQQGKIAFVARNRPCDLAAFLGMLSLGCRIRMVYPFQSAQAMASEIERIGPAVLVAADEDYGEPMFGVLARKGIAAIALGEMDAVSCRGFEHSRGTDDVPRPPEIEILTSGTTGPPKSFALGYDTIARHLVSPAIGPGGQGGNDAQAAPALLYFPVSNISGLYSTLPPLLKGQPVVLLERFTVAGWHDHLLRFRPTLGGLPPAGIQMVLDAGIPAGDLACLRAIGTGAAPLDPAVQRLFEERYGVPILLSYGATEFGGPVTRMTPELHAAWGGQKPGSVGRALPGVKLRIVDADTGSELPPGQEGILEVVSPRIGPDWIRTSDIAMVDEDGFLFHRGRTDGAIMRGGFKLLPHVIERALLQHPALAATAVVGIADRRLGQVPAAALEFKQGVEPPCVADMAAHLRKLLPATHIPAAWQVVDAIPRTPSMKADMPAVRRLFEEHPFT